MSKATNLLKETLSVLSDCNKTSDDVRFVSDGSIAVSWDGFSAQAAEINYDAGFGIVWISLDLVVVGDDWWLEREEYDGCEGWTFKTLPTKPRLTPTFLKILYRVKKT